MELLLPAGTTSVSVGRTEFTANEHGIIDVGNLDSASIELLKTHAGCKSASKADLAAAAAADDAAEMERRQLLEFTAEANRALTEGAERKAEVIKALGDLGFEADTRRTLKILEQQLAEARAEMQAEAEQNGQRAADITQVPARTPAEAAERKADVVKALTDLGLTVDNRRALRVLEQQLAEARAAAETQVAA